MSWIRIWFIIFIARTPVILYALKCNLFTLHDWHINPNQELTAWIDDYDNDIHIR